MIHIRQADMNDYNMLRELEQGVVNTERPLDPTIREDHVEYYDLGKLLNSPHAVVLVGETDGEIIATGYAVIKQGENFNRHKEFVYLGFMFVKESWRGQGINRMMLDKLLEWAREKQVYEIRLEVYAENINAIRAYDKAGFKPLLLSMRMDIK